jgi:septum formation protein
MTEKFTNMLKSMPMAKNTFWLASNSPRRREMLGWLDWDIQPVAVDIDESRWETETARDYVMRVSREKAQAFIKDSDVNSVIIAADTIVVLDDEILGKPRDVNDAFAILSALRGRTHEVLTAIAIRTAAGITQDMCCSPVRMRNYTTGEIHAYIESGDPLDKAGAYAIQNRAFSPADDFNGCFASVMGMPLCHLERTLKQCGIGRPNQFALVCQNQLKYSCPITSRVMAGEDIG